MADILSQRQYVNGLQHIVVVFFQNKYTLAYTPYVAIWGQQYTVNSCGICDKT